MACEGYGEAPHDDVVQKFILVCQNFWKQHLDKLIGMSGWGSLGALAFSVRW